MADYLIQNQVVLIGEFDFSGRISEAALQYGADAKENSALGDVAHSMLPGLKNSVLTAAGWWDGTTFDPGLFAKMQAAAFPCSVLLAAAEGSVSYTLQAIAASYEFFGEIGEVCPFKVRAESGDGLAGIVRGTLIHNQARTASGNGTIFQLGTVGAAQRLHAALHVLAVSGTTPTLDAIIQSDDNAPFSSPTTRITFGQKTALASEYQSIAGPITPDDRYRVSFTIGGTTPSFTFALCLGIQ